MIVERFKEIEDAPENGFQKHDAPMSAAHLHTSIDQRSGTIDGDQDHRGFLSSGVKAKSTKSIFIFDQSKIWFHDLSFRFWWQRFRRC
jgi:hypothetical protein